MFLRMYKPFCRNKVLWKAKDVSSFSNTAYQVHLHTHLSGLETWVCRGDTRISTKIYSYIADNKLYVVCEKAIISMIV